MIKERIQEILDFSKSESPYRKANKGWINQDIFLDLNPSYDTLKQKNEVAKVTLLWSPINNLLSNIFLVLIICSILVFTSLSFAKGRFDFNFLNTSLTKYSVKVQDDKVSNKIDLNNIDSINVEIEQSLEVNEEDQTKNINSLDDNPITTDKKAIDNKIDQEETIIKDIESKKESKILKNNKSQSNFI